MERKKMTSTNYAGIVASTAKKSIDPVQMQSLEQSFRAWASAPAGANRKLSRKRVLLIFLLIRYTGAKLNEILTLHPLTDIDCTKRIVLFQKGDAQNGSTRQVQIPELLADEIKNTLSEFSHSSVTPELFKIDPAHVRRKFL